jgi:uncharacterized membrane protein
LKTRHAIVLLLINTTAIILIAVINYLPAVVRIILGFPFVLFVPGFTLMLALFPKINQVKGIERIALSFAMSIAIVPLIGLGLNFSPWGITLTSSLYAIAAFVIIMSVIGWIRVYRLQDDEICEIRWPSVNWQLGKSAWDIILSIILLICIVGAVGAVIHFASIPRMDDNFTEFYLLGEKGMLADYPRDLILGEEVKVKVGIINHENKSLIYRVNIKINGEEITNGDNITLNDKEKWEGDVNVVPIKSGDNQKIEFFVLKGQETVPSLAPLNLWVNVNNKNK